MIRKILFLTLTLAALTATAQERNVANYERVLLPILMREAPGASGAKWQTDLWLRNESSTPVDAFPMKNFCLTSSGCYLMVRSAPSIAPNSTDYFLGPGGTIQRGTWIPPAPSGGGLLYVERGRSEDLRFSLHVADVSRRDATAGTIVPVVRERDAFVRPVSILNVPADPRYRISLRIYDFDSRTVSQVRVRILENTAHFEQNPLRAVVNLLGEAVIHLTHPAPEPDCGALGGCMQENFKLQPGFAFIADLATQFPGIAAIHPLANGMRIEIEPLTPGLRFWTMASTANNETNHVTLYYPE